ncbi:MAG: sulfite exporter TauE/SafE family protein [Balneolaceae bacterium]
MIYWILYILLGAVTGFLAGLFGIGGGGVMVPVLTILYLWQGIQADVVVHMALATSMAAIMFTSLSSLRAHHSRKSVLWPVAFRLAAGVLIGTYVTASLTWRLSGDLLALIFTLFMGFVAYRMISNRELSVRGQLPGSLGLSAAGAGIGSLSALVAIGGGSLTVPFLAGCNVSIHKAIGTSAAIGFPIALAGTAGYLSSGWGIPGLPAGSVGYIYLPAALAVSVMSVLTAPLGASVAHSLPVRSLRRLFGLLLLALSLMMLYRVGFN